MAIPRPNPRPFHRRRLLSAGARLARRWSELGELPKGQQRPVMVIPGFLAMDVHTFPLRRHLRRLDWAVHGWGQGFNHGDVPKLLAQLTTRLARVHAEHDLPVSLVGWSLGGIFARELGRQHPELVRRVVTLGSPIQGGAKYTAFAGTFERWFGADLDAVELQIARRHEATPLRVPVTSVFSKADAVVQWQASQDPWTPHAEHVEVSSSHVGLIVEPDVLEVVGRVLGRDVP